MPTLPYIPPSPDETPTVRRAITKRSAPVRKSTLPSVGLLVACDPSNPDEQPFRVGEQLSGVREGILAHGATIRVLKEPPYGESAPFVEQVEKSGVSALLCVGALETELLVALYETGLPMVLLDHRVHGLPCDCVTADYELASSMGTIFLLEQGCGVELALVIDRPGTYADRHLRTGIRNLVDTRRLSRKSIRVIATHADPNETRIALRTLFTAGPQPRGILCFRDALPSLSGALIEAGLQTPRDLSIVCFDEPDASVLLRPTTYFRTNYAAMGRAAVERLWGRLSGNMSPPMHLVAEGDLAG